MLSHNYPEYDLQSHVTTTVTTVTRYVDPPGVSSSSYDLEWSRWERSWNRQPRPWKTTLAYESRRSRAWPGTFMSTICGGDYGGDVLAEVSGTASIPLGVVESYTVNSYYVDQLAHTQNACLDMAKGETFESAVFAAEFGKASNYVGNFAKAVSDGVRSFRQFKRDPARAFRSMQRAFERIRPGETLRKTTRSAASLWLQYRYVISTGILDMQSMGKTMAEVASAHRMAERVVRANRTTVQGEGSIYWPYQTSPVLGGIVTGATASFVATVHTSAWLRVKPNFTNSVTWEASKLGLLNPLVVLWELSFLSFVADWVLDLGDYLARLNALAGLTVVDGGTAVTRRGVMTVHLEHQQRRWWEYTTTVYEPPVSECSIYQRSVWANPAPTWTPKISMSTKRWIDAAALIRTFSGMSLSPRDHIKT